VGSFGTLSESIGSTSSTLLARVKSRDQDAWRRLVRIYGPLVGFWLRRSHLQPEDADDVFQEIFQAVAKGVGQFEKAQPGSTFRGWLRTITRNKLADHFRRGQRESAAVGGTDAGRRMEQVQEPTEDTDVAEEEALKELRKRVMDLMEAEFEPRTWQMFWRVTAEGQAVKDVAADLGVTPGAVRVAKSRVLQRLREELRSLEDI
jgi:RNA polymerase sigma-70 factor (ECF subfamily)